MQWSRLCPPSTLFWKWLVVGDFLFYFYRFLMSTIKYFAYRLQPLYVTVRVPKQRTNSEGTALGCFVQFPAEWSSSHHAFTERGNRYNHYIHRVKNILIVHVFKERTTRSSVILFQFCYVEVNGLISRCRCTVIHHIAILTRNNGCRAYATWFNVIVNTL